MTMDIAAVRQAARDTLGHRTLLPGQADAIRAITDGRDTLALLPTGGGKSAIYQLAGLSIDGPTVVVSPLLALQHDQLAGLRELELPAAVVNASIPERERAQALDDYERGRLEFLLLSPESLTEPTVLARIAATPPSLLVVDEAHCVAEWGRDFRPAYRRLGAVATELGRPPILALTATASPLLRDEIVERLGLRDPAIIARGFDRPNLTLAVEIFGDADDKRAAVVERATVLAGAGIVYVATRRAATEVAAALGDAGVAAEAYHAGLGAARRRSIQDAFAEDRIRVVVATIAFGMGIDKPDVRFVLHHDVSESVDAYHQEIGRAGRDGDRADVVLFYRPEDLGLRRYQASPARFDEREVGRVLRALGRRHGADVAALAGAAHVSRRRTQAIVDRLEEHGLLEVGADGMVRSGQGDDAAEPLAVAAAIVAAQDRRRSIEQSRVAMIRAYAETTGCRRGALLGYFGEPFEPPCDNCDRCLAGDVERAAATNDAGAAFAVHDRVLHATFGAGTVTGLDGGRLTIAFEGVGYRTFDPETVTEGRLLVPIPD